MKVEEELMKLQASATQQWDRGATHIHNIIDNPQELLQHPSVPVVCGAFVVGVGVGLLLPRLRQPFRRFATVEDIPNKLFQAEGQIRAHAVNFSDGDTFRVRHLPLFRSPGTFDGKVSDHTLQIRLAGIGALENFLLQRLQGPHACRVKHNIKG